MKTKIAEAFLKSMEKSWDKKTIFEKELLLSLLPTMILCEMILELPAKEQGDGLPAFGD